MSPPHALASGAELQRWTGGPQPPFTQPSTNGADVAKVDLPVCRLIETTPVDYPVLLDRECAVARAWKVATLPNTFVLDADLRPRLVVEAEFAWGPDRSRQVAEHDHVGAGGARSSRILSKRSHRGG